MRKTTLLLLLSFGFSNCSETPKPNEPVPQSPSADGPTAATLSGYYMLGDEVNMFRNCADNKQYWVRDETRLLDSLYHKACLPAPIPYEAVYAVFTGALGPKDSVGFSAETDGIFTVTRVDTLQSKNKFNACLPWEFWCSGTEPFWSLQISEAEGGIFFKNMADDTGQQFAWDEPQTDGESFWTYEINAQSGSEDRLKIAIKKAKCSDGMSDIQFDYSVEATVGEKTLRGCAVRGGKPVPRSNN